MSDKGDRRPGLYRVPDDEIPPFLEAVAQYQDPAKQALIGQAAGSNDLEWDAWKATIEYGRRSKFDTILDFFVNLPSLQDVLADESVTDSWYWTQIEPVTLEQKFYYRRELLRLLRANAGADALINEGWMVKYTAGRIDTETTWTDNSFLIGTNGYFAYIQLYMIIIH